MSALAVYLDHRLAMRAPIISNDWRRMAEGIDRQAEALSNQHKHVAIVIEDDDGVVSHIIRHMVRHHG